MAIFSRKCLALIPDQTLSAAEVALHPGDLPAKLLKGLRDANLSAKTVSAYYGAFKRALALSGHTPVSWPSAPLPPRKTRDPLSGADQGRLLGHLREAGESETADLLILLAATGLRVSVEALSPDHLRVSPGDSYDTLHVIGKGGHERTIPVVEPEARAILADPKRLADIALVAYSTHLKRWNRGLNTLGVTSRLATPHAVRHAYASDVLRRSGGNLTMVQELLGHTDPATTARYLETKLDEKASALTKEPL